MRAVVVSKKELCLLFGLHPPHNPHRRYNGKLFDVFFEGELAKRCGLTYQSYMRKKGDFTIQQTRYILEKVNEVLSPEELEKRGFRHFILGKGTPSTVGLRTVTFTNG